MKFLWRLIGITVALAPVGILAFWGASYFLGCLYVLSAPGENVSLPLSTPGGTLTVFAETYAVDPMRGEAKFSGISIREPNGNVLVSAAGATIFAPHVLRMSDSFVRVRLRGVSGRLERNEKGELTLLRYFPEPTSKVKPTPIEISIDGLALQVVDRVPRDDRTYQVVGREIRFSTAAFAWRASGELELESGRIDANVLWTPDSEIRVSGKLHGVEAARIWQHLNDLPESATWGQSREISAQSARVSGNFDVSWKEGLAPSIRVRPTIDYGGLATPYWPKSTQGRFEGWITQKGAGGIVSAKDGASNGEIIGQAAWTEGFSLLGETKLEIASLTDISSKILPNVPKGLKVHNSKINATLHVVNDRFEWSGIATARSADFEKEKLFSPVASFSISERGGSVKLDSGQWRTITPLASVSWSFPSGKINGFAEVSSISLGPIAKNYSTEQIEGTASAKLHLTGTLAHPMATLRTNGNASIRIQDKGPDQSATFDISAKWNGEQISIDRFLATSRQAIATGTGTIAWPSKHLNIEAKVVGADVSEWLSEAGGFATAKVTIRGTLAKPEAKGRAEILTGNFRDEPIPILVGDILLDRKKAVVTNLSAVRGASRIDGKITYNFNSEAIEGHLQGNGIQLADLLGNQYGGSISLKGAEFSGTINEPIANSKIEGTDLVFHGVRIETLKADFRLADEVAEINGVELQSGKSSWTGSGWLNMGLRSGRISGQASDLNLANFAPIIAKEFVVAGTVNAITTASWQNSKLSSVLLDGTIDDLLMNDIRIGSGTVVARTDGEHWSGKLDIGFAERFIQIPEFRYSISDRTLETQIVILSLPFREVFRGVKGNLISSSLEPLPNIVQLPESLMTTLDRIQGDIDLDVTITGVIDDPRLEIGTASVSKLKLADEESGEVSLKAVREPKGRWNIQQLTWNSGPGTFSATGSIDETENMNIQGDINNFSLPWLSLFDSRMANMQGVASVSFDATGLTKSPLITATIGASLFPQPLAQGGTGPPIYGLTAAIGPIQIRDGEITVEGDFNARGIRGGIDGTIPFSLPFSIPSNQPISLAVSIPKRHRTSEGITQDALDLSQFATDLPGLVLGGKTHTVQANVQIGGTIENLQYSGRVTGDIDQFGWKGLETSLHDLDFEAKLQGEQIRFEASASSNTKDSQGKAGTAKAVLTLTIPELLNRLDANQKTILSTPINGRINVTDFRIRELFAGNGALDVVADAAIRIGGSLKAPTISTVFPATFQSLSATMPSEFPEVAGGETPIIDPKFSISYIVAQKQEPAKFRAATASFNVFGAGSILGTLSAPVVSTGLNVDSGTIRLPNARVSIEEGGKARFSYRSSTTGPGDFRLDVDLKGRTGLSSVRHGGTVQRYDIDLAIRGNILEESTQFITARSDPPDLDQNQILNMLGQRELFEGIAGQFFGKESGRQLAGTLAGVAVPALFDPFTARLAQELGLEYLSLEYNAFEGATLTGAVSLGRGILLQGRRQITETLQERIQYDFRLTWRPSSRFDQIRNLIFSLGTDQDRPWKISVEYGIRF
jgi:hypothetical protein